MTFRATRCLRAVRHVLETRRAGIYAGTTGDIRVHDLALGIRETLYQRARPSLRRVINATGIVLHTGLGRAPLSEEAIEAIADVASGYCNLELDLDSGRRGQRQDHLRELLCELTGAEDAAVVNNNAAATYLVLSTLSAGAETIVSRGQLVEIGGSYRMPDIMTAAGCHTVEVGTTNRTHLRDYEQAITEHTRVLLRVNTSNYRIQGFVASPKLGELVALAQRYESLGITVVDDLGSGLIDTGFAGVHQSPESAAAAVPAIGGWDEPTVRESLAAGADLTLFSGDKLLGGPQAGVIVGKAALISRLHASPLMRTFRPGKLTLAGLEATLRLYRDPATVVRRLPHLRMLTAPAHQLRARAERLADEIGSATEMDANRGVRRFIRGGGTLPVLPFPTWVVRVQFASQSQPGSRRRVAPPRTCRSSVVSAPTR